MDETTLAALRGEMRTYLSLAVGVFWVGIAAITFFAGFLQNLLNRRRIKEEADQIFEERREEFERQFNSLKSNAMYSLALGFAADKNYGAAIEFHIYAAYFYCLTEDFISAKEALERANKRLERKSLQRIQINTSKMAIITTYLEKLKTYADEIDEELFLELENNFAKKFKLISN